MVWGRKRKVVLTLTPHDKKLKKHTCAVVSSFLKIAHASSSRAAKFGIRSLSVALHLAWRHGDSREFPSFCASAAVAPTYRISPRNLRSWAKAVQPTCMEFLKALSIETCV